MKNLNNFETDMTALIIFALMLAPACTMMDCSQSQLPNKRIEQINFKDLYSISSHFETQKDQLQITIDLAENLHAYARGEKTGKPVGLKITNKNGWLADGPPVIPSGTKKNLGVLGESQVLTKKIFITQKLIPGVGPGNALLYLQVCTSNACDRPRAHEITWP